MEFNEILFTFLYGSIRFHFYSYGIPRDFTFIYMGFYEISLLVFMEVCMMDPEI